MTEHQAESNSILHCFKCGRQLQVDPASGALIDALSFLSYGGWGSEYDPMDNRKFLRIHICDACVDAEAKQGNVLEATRVPQPAHVTYAKWKAEPVEH